MKGVPTTVNFAPLLAADAVNVFYHYTYGGSVDIDAVRGPTMKA